MLLHELLRQGLDEQIALYEKEATYSYAQLKKKVEQFRNYLYFIGVRPSDRVGLFAKNSSQFIFSYMAVVSLGGAVIPLNTLLTGREIAFILNDADAKFILTDKELNLNTGDDTTPTTQILLQDISAATAREQFPAAPSMDIKETDLCVIIYTSGTTGRPKGAMLSHRNLVTNAVAFADMSQTTAGENILCVLPMFHSFGWTCCVDTALYAGASITIVENFSPRDVIAAIRNYGITVVIGVPVMYGYYAKMATPGDLSGVRLFVSGGAALPLEIINSFYTKTKKKIVEGYGLSEASPVCTFNPLEATKPGSIGLPIAGVEVIIKNNGREAATGEVGEILVRGPNVMLGYYGMPAETGEALRDGWLHTGDLAYKDEDGYIFLVDRKKDLVIVSGLNVYPREIEEALYQYPAVMEAAVIGIPDQKRGEIVRAFIVVKEGMEINKKELLNYLKMNLASYKLPRGITELKSLPKTATGKISKLELRKMYLEQSTLEQ
ncbi:MAG: long-chain-fatty-acid--CoA ligase [Pelotomaculum sp.]